VGEYNLLEKGYVDLPTQVENEEVTVDFERAVSGERLQFKTAIVRRTFPVGEVAAEIYRRLSDIDMESKEAVDPEDRTQYTKQFTLERCEEIIKESLKQANIQSGCVTEENKQRILQALGPLRRKSAKRVIYTLAPQVLKTLHTSSKPMETCSAAELRRGSKSVFYIAECGQSLPDEQQSFFHEAIDPDGDFASACVEVPNPADFKTPVYLSIADAKPERMFMRELCKRENASHLDNWLKNTHMGFYSLEYAWKKGEHPKRGEFSPDFFILKSQWVFVLEIKDDGEINEPSTENIKKHEYAREHFNNLNDWLEKENIPIRYQFNMLSPKNFNMFFQMLREDGLKGFKSELDVTILKAGRI
jgi:type III restriction enzyme